MSDEAERRCPTCGALVSAEADWCGQCYSPLGPKAAERRGEREPMPASVPAPTAVDTRSEPETEGRVVPLQAREGEPAWPCAVCGNRNPIELDVCAACGTPFARSLQEPERPPDVPPRTAMLWSLAFPGLGHLRCGKAIDGVARAVLFLWTGGLALLLVLSRSGKGGLGPIGALIALFLLAALVVYATSALDAHRLASGEPPLVSSRVLLWGSAGLMVLSVVLAAALTVSAVRSR